MTEPLLELDRHPGPVHELLSRHGLVGLAGRIVETTAIANDVQLALRRPIGQGRSEMYRRFEGTWGKRLINVEIAGDLARVRLGCRLDRNGEVRKDAEHCQDA